MPVTGKEEVGCEGVCKVKEKDRLWESSGRMKGLMVLCCKLPGSVKHRARICVGKTLGLHTGYGKRRGTSRC